MNLEKLYEKLESFSDFKNEENLMPFIETFEEIVSYHDPKSISILVKYFDDHTDYNWIMQSMIHALESYPREIYVPEIVKCLPQNIKHSPYWMENLFNRIFNDEKYLKCFKENITLVPKEDMLDLLDLVSQESEHHEELCDKLRNLVEENGRNQ